MTRTDSTQHFTCVRCGHERDRKRELSHTSKGLMKSPRFKSLSEKEQAKYLMCRDCAHDTKNLPNAIASAIANRGWWERKVTPEEITPPREEPVTTDHLLTFSQAAKEAGVSAGTIAYWVKKGHLAEYSLDGVRTVKKGDLYAYLDERTKPGSGHKALRSDAGSAHRPVGGPRQRATVISKARTKALAQAVRAERTRQKMTLAQLANIVGMYPTSIGRIERGESRPRRDSVHTLEGWLVLAAPTCDYVTRYIHKNRQSQPADQQLPPWEQDDIAAKIRKLEYELQAALANEQRIYAELNAHRRWVTKYRDRSRGWKGWDELDRALKEAKK